jgi:predicted phage tail component-like protein
MTYKQSLYFTYDGIHSSDFGILNVNSSGGLYEEQSLPTREIVEEKTFFRDEPYFFGFDYQPREFSIEAYFEEGWDDDSLAKVKKWLFQDTYKPLSFSDNPDIIYYCAVINTPTQVHNGLEQGYLKLDFRCNSPYVFSPVYFEKFYVTEEEATVQIENKGAKLVYPIISVMKSVSGDVSITNLNHGGQTLSINNMTDRETVTIDNYNEIVETNDVSHESHIYNDVSDDFLELVTGVNNLKLAGNGIFEFKYQVKFL